MNDTTIKYKIHLLLKLLLGLVFVFSAISKLLPIETFEFTIIRQGITDWNTVPYLSRFIIGIELAMGIGFLQNNLLKKLIYPSSFLLLLVFTVHLSLIVLLNGDVNNCGCFGEILPMSPLQAVFKNILFMIILVVLYILKIKDGSNLKYPMLILFISVITVFTAYPIKPYKTQETGKSESIQNSGKARDTIKITGIIQDTLRKKTTQKKDSVALNKTIILPHKSKSIFSSYKEYSSATTDPDEGIKIIALFSLTCEDCMEKAKEIKLLSKKIKNLPLYILFWGEPEQVKDFFEFAGGSFPYKLLEPQEFFPLIKNSPPRICLLANGNILYDWDAKSFNINLLEKELTKYKTH